MPRLHRFIPAASSSRMPSWRPPEALRSVRHSRQFVEWQSLADVYITPESGQIADVSVGPLRADFVAK